MLTNCSSRSIQIVLGFLGIHNTTRRRNIVTDSIKTVTVLGTGCSVPRSAFQSAFKGFTVTAYDINDKVLETAKDRFQKLAETYANEVPDARDGKAQEALNRPTLTSDLAAAVADADLVIEAIPEILDLKRRPTRSSVNSRRPRRSSPPIPRHCCPVTSRIPPAGPTSFWRCTSANRVWQFNTAEIMGTTDTDPAVFAEVVEFAKAIGMVPIELHKEKAGYVLNSSWCRSSTPPPNWPPAATPTPAPSTTPGGSPPAHPSARSRSTTSSA